MLTGAMIIVISFLYLLVLFAIAYWGDKRADMKRSVIANPYIYALSIAVYCTSWTFYGSVGRAASGGLGFLPIYLGPTLAFVLGWYLIRKIIRISKVNRITTIADFIASRYGKSSYLGGLVAVMAIVGITPYISLQLKAITMSFGVLLHYPDIVMPAKSGSVLLLQDTALYVAIIMAAFAILFGTRHIDASEHHEGMVAAVAFESVVKLVAFLAAGIAITFGIFNGFGDIFEKAAASQTLSRLFVLDGPGTTSWIALTILAMAAVIVLPRQFQVVVVENVDERHLKTAMWLFPLYLLLINLFVLPIALAGDLAFGKGVIDADTYVLALPMKAGMETIAILVFIGGLSAATGMIIVETVALATMACNDLVMPLLFRFGRLHLLQRRDLTGLLLAIRRGTIVVVLLLSYAYVRLIGESYALVTIGLVSFVAAMQWAPPIVGGVLWKGATRQGAIAGLTGGFIVWCYTLLVPSFARSGWIDDSILTAGPLGLAFLVPQALFGLTGMDSISHALFWTMVFNVGLYVAVSLTTSQTLVERSQANQFVEIFRRSHEGERVWRGRATIGDLRRLLTRFIGEARTEAFVQRQERYRDVADDSPADSAVVAQAERQLAGAIGAASARIMMASVLREEMRDMDEVMQILDEASQVIVYSRRLEEKSRELEAATNELRAANERLKELDKMKDDFVSTVSHELRTPLTSIRSFSEIVRDNPDLSIEERSEFLQIIVTESERLTRLINDILDLAKMEAGQTEWTMADMAPGVVIAQALQGTAGLFATKPHIRFETDIAPALPLIHADADRLTQVIVNLISNAVKFCDKTRGVVRLTAREDDGMVVVSVRDNGQGIDKADHARIFERFQQAGDVLTDKPQGTGLGLPICQEIVRHFGGEIRVDSELGEGATFTFRVPAVEAATAQSIPALAAT